MVNTPTANIVAAAEHGIALLAAMVRNIAQVDASVKAIIDNVSLVATTMGMYDLTSFPIDSEFWLLITFYAGTSGSMLVNGFAAGVAYMGMEKVDFFWYLQKVMLLILLPIWQFIAFRFPYQQL
ncbi:hypothetical protein FEM48_Zijuj07G0148100 [Ziziphus jujuba var. spinosa]|uniref:Uncharacterized protein n=1 Tax=Ziziphus jujuba var. spinosa TaxID=714518 RepID=A0A978V595_ZIZJJ|nr:hypothetical protein FEM48_Zijuj07G0148100 [Ziziphus jujuba var. spinosa]